MLKKFGPQWVPRTILALISLVIVLFGVTTLLNGKIDSYNSWRQIAFAPVAILCSLGFIIAIFKPGAFAQPPKKKSRYRGWPKGRSRY